MAVKCCDTYLQNIADQMIVNISYIWIYKVMHSYECINVYVYVLER